MKDYKCLACGQEFKSSKIQNKCPYCESKRIKRLWCTNFVVKGYNYKNGYSKSK